MVMTKDHVVKLVQSAIISVVLLMLITPLLVSASYIDTLRPNVAGDATELTPVGETNNYECVDEVTSDEDATYVYCGAMFEEDKYDLYDLPASSGSGTINSVTVYVRVKTLSPMVSAYIKIKTHATVYEGDQETPGFSYVNFSKQWSANPNTGSSWTWAEIDALQIGVRLVVEDGSVRCTQVYVEVECAEAIPEFSTLLIPVIGMIFLFFIMQRRYKK